MSEVLNCFLDEQIIVYIYKSLLVNNNNNNNINNRVYTPLSEKFSQSRVFISQCHMNHIIQYYAYELVWFI